MSAINALFLLTHLSGFTLKCSIYDTPCLSSLTQKYASLVIPGGTGLGFETLDPMLLEPIKKEQDGLSFNVSDIEVLGLKNILIDKFQFNKKDQKALVKFRVPCVTVFGNYSSNGSAQNVQLIGEGKLIKNLYDVDIDFIINYEIITGKDHKVHIKFIDYLYWFNMRFAETFLQNINKDDAAKAKAANEVMQKDYGRLWQQYGRHFLDKYNDKIFETVKKVLLILPAEHILSDYQSLNKT